MTDPTFIPGGARQISLLTRMGAGPAQPVASITLPPEFTARFELGPMLGAGAMGTVYRATERAAGRDVAIKFLTRIDDPALLARFLNEGKLLASVRHRCVIALHEVQALDGFPYLVTEYVEGGTVRSLLEVQRTLAPELALHLVTQMLDGLHAFHSRGIVHRDLKPENVLVTENAEVRLADLGIAKKYGDQRGLKNAPDTGAAHANANAAATMVGALIGTPRYMAPEQVRGEPAVIASDLHAAGAMLYEMLCGHPPYDAPTLPELLHKIEHEPPPALTQRARVHPVIAKLVHRALAKRLSERPSSAQDLATALRKVSDQLPPQSDDRLKFSEHFARVIRLRDKVRRDLPPAPPPAPGSLAMPPEPVQHLDRVATRGRRVERPLPPPPPPSAAAAEEKALRAAVDRDARSPRPHLALGEFLAAAGRYAEAEMAFRTAIQREPKSAYAQVQLGLLLARTGKPDKAEQRLRAAVAAEPSSAWVHQALGDHLIAQGRARAAGEAYRAGLECDPQPSALNYRVIITLREVDSAAARAVLETLVKSDPQNGWARRQLDELRGDRPRRSLADYQALASAYRQSGAAHFDLARALERAGRVADARAAYEAAAGDPAYAWVAYDLERLAKDGA